MYLLWIAKDLQSYEAIVGQSQEVLQWLRQKKKDWFNECIVNWHLMNGLALLIWHVSIFIGLKSAFVLEAKWNKQI